MQNDNYRTNVMAYGINRIYVKEYNNVPKPKVKSLTAFFLSLHFCFGIDYGFAGMFSVKTKNILTLYSTLFSIFTFIVILIPYNTIHFLIWYWLTAFECLFFLIVLKAAKYSVFNFITDMQNMNCIYSLKESFGICVASYSYCMFITKLSLVFFRCLYGNTSNCDDYEPGVHELYAIFSNVLDFIPVSAIIIYYLIHCAITNMRESLEKEMDVSKFLNLYRAVADCCDKIRPLYDSIVSIMLQFFCYTRYT